MPANPNKNKPTPASAPASDPPAHDAGSTGDDPPADYVIFETWPPAPDPATGHAREPRREPFDERVPPPSPPKRQ